MRRRASLLLPGAILAGTLATAPAFAAVTLGARAAVRPGVAHLGERVLYRGQVVAPSGTNVRWMPPEPQAELSWGPARVGRSPGIGGTRDTTWIEIPLQVFDTGTIAIPGVRFVVRGGPPEVHRLPVARLRVDPLIAPNDSTARLRELRAVTAPWWERVPWMWIVIALLLVAAAIVLWRLRKRKVEPVPVAAPVVARRDPAAEALAAIAVLRAEGLPASGRFAEHAFRLGQILRRYLEATMGTTRPGDTTPELVAHLRDAGLDAEQLQRLSGVLRTWDRIKFAREPFTAAEALRTEEAVEAFVRRPARPAAEQVA